MYVAADRRECTIKNEIMSKNRTPILPESTGEPIKTNLNQLDRIKAYYIEKQELSPEDEEYRLTLSNVNHWLELGSTMAEAREALEKDEDYPPSEANKIVSDALELYGNIAISNKEGLRNLLTNHFLRLAKKAEEESNLFVAGQNYERAVRLNNLHEVQETTQKGRRVQMSYTRNPEALKNQNKEEKEAG